MYNITEAVEKELHKNDNRLDSMEDIDIFEITPQELATMKYSKPIKDMFICNKCKHIFSADEMIDDTVVLHGNSTVYAGFDNYYDDPYEYEKEIKKCPYCYSTDISDLYTDDIDDTIPNIDEYIDGYSDYAKSIVTESKEDNKSSNSLEFDDLHDEIKKEMYKYLKSNGIDVEHLIKSGVELETLKPVLDKLLDTYVATCVADYENNNDIGIEWDYDIQNNDIIISVETM